MKIYRDFLLPSGLLAGTIIGAGIFALPYVFKESGLSIGFFYLILGALVYAVIHLMYADVIMRTSGEHRFVGYARIYLGPGAAWLSVIMTVLEMLVVMTIYLVLSISFSNIILASGAPLAKLLIFWFFGSAAIFLSLRKLAFLELLIAGGMIAIIGAIFFLGLENFIQAFIAGAAFPNLKLAPDFSRIFFPLSPVLFALGGRVAIPPLVKYFAGQRQSNRSRLIKKAIIAGTVIPAIVYALFVLGILGASGVVTEDAVSGLSGAAPSWVFLLIGILGLLSLWSSYIVIGLDVMNTLIHDLKFFKIGRLFFVVLGPLLLYFSGFQNFLGLVGIAGGIFLSLEGIFIIAMWQRANRRSGKSSFLIQNINPIVVVLFFLLFVAAFIQELAKIF